MNGRWCRDKSWSHTDRSTWSCWLVLFLADFACSHASPGVVLPCFFFFFFTTLLHCLTDGAWLDGLNGCFCYDSAEFIRNTAAPTQRDICVIMNMTHHLERRHLKDKYTEDTTLIELGFKLCLFIIQSSVGTFFFFFSSSLGEVVAPS